MQILILHEIYVILRCTIIARYKIGPKGGARMHEKIVGTSLPSVAALSYLGDARHSLYVRKMLVARGMSKSADLNKAALEYVTAEAQAEMLRRIEGHLLDDEREVFRRAANSTHLNKPKHAKISDYRYATGFEAVIGMLEWIGDEERLTQLLDIAHAPDAENEKE